MQPEIIAAALVFAGAVITSIAGAYATVRAASNKSKAESIESFEALRKEGVERENQRDVQLAVISTKVDTLWDIYAEDAIRQARTSGMVATKSPLAPTAKWDSSLSKELTKKIESDAVGLSEYLNSPYDVAIELWGKYKAEILESNGDSVRALWGTILVVSINATQNTVGVL